ncbi:hypothetical protein [Ketobacter sp.]|uniref:hypothetical protein n=1 Tax=Ketobacter sp. TaxID=2083498 RepID=UPI0025BA0BB6|nr:hypothetical protein [Ketobacter sp.]
MNGRKWIVAVSACCMLAMSGGVMATEGAKKKAAEKSLPDRTPVAKGKGKDKACSKKSEFCGETTSVPELNAASGLIALSLMAGIVAVFRERRLSIKSKAA